MTANTIDIAALDPAGLTRHLDDLADILHACVHDGASVGFVLPFDVGQARGYWRNKVAPGLAAGRRVVLIATIGDAVAGTVQLDLDTMPNQAHRGEVAKLLVHPRYRQSGVGRALMQQIEARGAAAGRWLLTLDTAGDTAERLYRGLGFQRAGSIPSYARDPIADRCDATVLMFKILPGQENRAP